MLSDYEIDRFDIGPITCKVLLDLDPINPRDEYDNLASIVTFRRTCLGDKNNPLSGRSPEEVLRSLACQATSAESMLEENVVPLKHVLRAVEKYYVCLTFEFLRDGSTIAGECREDTLFSSDGIIWLAKSKAADEGCSADTAEKIVRGELQEYSAYSSGQVYGYVLCDRNGQNVGSCWGYTDLEYLMATAREEASALRYVPEWY